MYFPKKHNSINSTCKIYWGWISGSSHYDLDVALQLSKSCSFASIFVVPDQFVVMSLLRGSAADAVYALGLASSFWYAIFLLGLSWVIMFVCGMWDQRTNCIRVHWIHFFCLKCCQTKSVMWHNIPEVNLALVVLLLVRTARFQTPQLSLTYDSYNPVVQWNI